MTTSPTNTNTHTQPRLLNTIDRQTYTQPDRQTYTQPDRQTYTQPARQTNSLPPDMSSWRWRCERWGRPPAVVLWLTCCWDATGWYHRSEAGMALHASPGHWWQCQSHWAWQRPEDTMEQCWLDTIILSLRTMEQITYDIDANCGNIQYSTVWRCP